MTVLHFRHISVTLFSKKRSPKTIPKPKTTPKQAQKATVIIS